VLLDCTGPGLLVVPGLGLVGVAGAAAKALRGMKKIATAKIKYAMESRLLDFMILIVITNMLQIINLRPKMASRLLD
jgi:hypothetical protein